MNESQKNPEEEKKLEEFRNEIHGLRMLEIAEYLKSKMGDAEAKVTSDFLREGVFYPQELTATDMHMWEKVQRALRGEERISQLDFNDYVEERFRSRGSSDQTNAEQSFLSLLTDLVTIALLKQNKTDKQTQEEKSSE